MGADTPRRCFDDSGDAGSAYGWRSPDAIVSGPLLGELCAPLLLTERDTPPTTAEAFLRSGEYVTGDAAGKLRITVLHQTRSRHTGDDVLADKNGASSVCMGRSSSVKQPS